MLAVVKGVRGRRRRSSVYGCSVRRGSTSAQDISAVNICELIAGEGLLNATCAATLPAGGAVQELTLIKPICRVSLLC